jgi:competence protein ComK
MHRRQKNIYEITRRTKAIITRDTAYSRARILEGYKELDVKHRPEEILDNTCIKYGASLDGRRKSAKSLLRIFAKVPVPVIPQMGVYMIPTASAKSGDCVWISYYHIEFYEQRDDKTYIYFTDGTGLYVHVSESVFDLQYKRTSQLIAADHRLFLFENTYSSISR